MAHSYPTVIPRFRSGLWRVKDISCPGRISLIVAVCLLAARANAGEKTNAPGVAVLLVDTDRVMGNVEEGVYGQFLEHINHSVEGLFAEQIQGRGYEGEDFQTHWNPFATNGSAEHCDNVVPKRRAKSAAAGRQRDRGGQTGRIYLQQGYDYNGSVWLKSGSRRAAGEFSSERFRRTLDCRRAAQDPRLELAGGRLFLFESANGHQRRLEIVARGTGAVLVDYISMMRADSRTNGMLRPDLFEHCAT